MSLDSLLAGPSSRGSRESALSLGLVNDLEEDIVADDEPRQVAGDELVSSSSKWHKHTVKVFSLLKRSMAGTDDDEGSKPSHLSFDSLSKEGDNCPSSPRAGRVNSFSHER